MNHPDPEASYVASVVTLYLEMPDTPMRVSASDQWLARHFHQDEVPLETIETALLLGSLRRLIRPADSPHLAPIRSLAYFRPSSRNSRKTPPQQTTATTSASNYAKPSRPGRQVIKKLRFLVSANTKSAFSNSFAVTSLESTVCASSKVMCRLLRRWAVFRSSRLASLALMASSSSAHLACRARQNSTVISPFSLSVYASSLWVWRVLSSLVNLVRSLSIWL